MSVDGSAQKQLSDDDVLDTPAAAEVIGVRPRTLEDWRRRRVGPPFSRVGQRLARYRRGDLKQYLEEQKVLPVGKKKRLLSLEAATKALTRLARWKPTKAFQRKIDFENNALDLLKHIDTLVKGLAAEEKRTAREQMRALKEAKAGLEQALAKVDSGSGGARDVGALKKAIKAAAVAHDAVVASVPGAEAIKTLEALAGEEPEL